MAKQQQTPQPESNSLCRAVGHDWHLSLSGDHRRCQRQQCKAVQRRERGTWTTVSVARPRHGPLAVSAKLQASPQQTALF
jgi:hypothetical protein